MAVPPELAKMLDLPFFHQNGYRRKTCPKCQDAFWTTDAQLELCGDSNCVEYDFIGNPLATRPLSVAEMRDAFQSFFEGKGHRRVPRNPVVARWRDDIYLNIASIANYQPHVTSGEVPPPANPLVVSQPCIRLNDLSNIGRSGRHFSCFEMMGHHAFNSKAWGEKYWADECVAYGVEFLTKGLGLDGRRITFKEGTWNGGGNAGPCVEVFAGGLEVATLVFMCLEEAGGAATGGSGPSGGSGSAGAATPENLYTIKGEKYRMMDLRIIDTGWGLERLAWASTGTPTAYDTVFPEAIAQVKRLATRPIRDDGHARRIIAEHARVQGILNLDIGVKLDGLREEVVKRLAGHGIQTTVAELNEVMGPVEAMYALCDHLRCLSFMVGDGIVPSNVKAGYLMRLVTRRALRFMEVLGIREPLGGLVAANMENMAREFPEFAGAIPRAREIMQLETERYHESRDKGLRLVQRMLQKRPSLSTEDLVELYDTHGLGPNTVAEAAAQVGVKVDIPDDFDMVVAARHSKAGKAEEKTLRLQVPPTELLYYKEQDRRTFSAKVLWKGSGRSEQGTPTALVALDRTCFFAETGGQPGDRGLLRLPDGAVFKVVDTTKDGAHAIHHCVLHEPAPGRAAADSERDLAPNAAVHGEVDWELRLDHTRSHTATHIMNQAVRRVLGSHSWQAGTQKYRDCARVDMTHYRRPTREELERIERLANEVVLDGRKVTRTWMKRDEAENKHGLTLLQGGIPKGRDVRVVEIADFDVEYCGGTHCATTHEVGPIKMTRTERIQDGVERFEYAAGLYAVDRWQDTERLLRAAAEELQVAPAEVPNSARRFFGEWKEQRKSLDTLNARLAELESQAASGKAEQVHGVQLVVSVLPSAALQKTAQELVAEPGRVALLAATDGTVRLLFARSPDVKLDMGALLRDVIPMVGGRGGGKPDFAQGGGTDASKVTECLQAARAKVVASLQTVSA